MWFFGFSTENPKNFWIIGAILLVILVTTAIRWVATHLHQQVMEDDDHENEKDLEADDDDDDDDDEVGKKGEKEEDELVQVQVISWCPGVIRTYALEELKVATRNFKVKIGIGATSFVYLAELGDGTFGAVKMVMADRGGSKKIFLDEVSVLLRISHPNLVGLQGFCLEKGEQLLLLEYVPNKSLFERLHTQQGQCSGVLTWANRVSIALDIARALSYLHSEADPPIIHRDVKSSNVLLIDNDHAKLADFGLCKLGYDKPGSTKFPTSIKGSFGYIDTNYLETGFVSPKSDIYSYGVLLLELITGLKSTQGSITLAEWTLQCRDSADINMLAKLLDPKLNGVANFQQLRVLVKVANSALLDDCEERPEMSQIVDSILSCIQFIDSDHPHSPV